MCVQRAALLSSLPMEVCLCLRAERKPLCLRNNELHVTTWVGEMDGTGVYHLLVQLERRWLYDSELSDQKSIGRSIEVNVHPDDDIRYIVTAIQ